MSRRNRGNAGGTYVNNVRGPTSALTSFLNERGIRRANPAPAPPPENVADNGDDNNEEPASPQDQAAPSSSSSTPAPASSSSRLTRTARLTRGRALPTPSTSASRSNELDGVNDDSDSDDSDSDDSDSDNKNLIPIAVSTSTTRAVRATRSRVAAVASSSSSSNTVASSSAPSSTAKAKAAAAAASKKRPRKKDASDDSDDEDFHDITGHISRSNFSHKGRIPQGSNKIVFCSRCRARFTIKAGTTPAVDEDDGGLLCPSCAGTGSPGPLKNTLPKAKPVKRARRKAQKAEIECHIPTLQDLCIQKIANSIEDVEAFGDISDISLDKICKIISRNRSLNAETLQLFLDARHSELILYDCTDITAIGLQNIAQFCPNLRSLKLKLCGRITNEVMDYYTEHLTKLASLTLIGPILILEHTYIKLFETIGTRFEKFELKGSSRFSLKAIKALCDNCPNITHLRLGDCNLMDDEWLEPIAGLTKLKSLRIRNPEPDKLTTSAVVKLVQAVGSGLEELELKGCNGLTDEVLVDAIRPSCVRVERLNLSGCEDLTTEGVETLFKDWSVNSGLTYINLENCVMLKDEALMAVTEHSGATLEELNLSGMDEITKDALQTLTRCGLKIVGREGDYVDLRFM
ncbi:hypothetical protein BGZ96_012400 [Linnemannia gamsii]|uniref:F-box/LRR-repeat protein 15-like leucin rich repeat domain-containing protein n=1 Tax=Linnemannia gamsii TaxID=64522 RepID=A0ABQ7JQQ9_9FUNG|nr:hypothetical protein BGZ96_012400 [Linnemannia gamsii]